MTRECISYVPARNVAGALRCSISEEAHSGVGTVMVLPMKVSVKMLYVERADKLRARLGWPQRRALVLPIAVKPKGMWSKTFERLRGYAIAAESIAAAAQAAHLARLLGRFERRKRRAQQV